MNQAGAVFLDRDGTVIEEIGYLDRVDRLSLYPWSIDAIRALNRAGFRVVLVTNQSGDRPRILHRSDCRRGASSPGVAAGRGRRAHRRVLLLSAPSRRQRRGVCETMRMPEAGPGTRRPRGRRNSASIRRQSFVVGDRWLDVELARAIGGRGILVRTGYGAGEERRPPAPVDGRCHRRQPRWRGRLDLRHV